VRHLHQPLAGAQRAAEGVARLCGRALIARAPMCEGDVSIHGDDKRTRVATSRANRRRRGLTGKAGSRPRLNHETPEAGWQRTHE
jgi:hypothetical protein